MNLLTLKLNIFMVIFYQCHGMVLFDSHVLFVTVIELKDSLSVEMRKFHKSIFFCSKTVSRNK